MVTPYFKKGLDLRLEHSHGFNIDNGQGGHYHYDTTPDVVEYTAYYNIAEGSIRFTKTFFLTYFIILHR